MYCRVIACDFDGTGAIDGLPAPELYAALAAARAEGIITLPGRGCWKTCNGPVRNSYPSMPWWLKMAPWFISVDSAARSNRQPTPPDRFLEVIRRFGIDGGVFLLAALLLLCDDGGNEPLRMSENLRHENVLLPQGAPDRAS